MTDLQPDHPSQDAITTATASPAPVPGPKGLAISALVVGIVAFLSGLAPVWGIIVGGAAVALGALALARKQSKGLALTGLILGSLAALSSLAATVALFAGVASINSLDAVPAPVSVAPVETAEPTEEAEPSQEAEPTVEPTPEAPAETVSQANARRSAESYLSFTSFSRTGLIEQLEFEGYSTEDATYGVDAVGADWNQQAAQKAADYLDISPFSRSGLIEQLIFEGFTPAEAEFGVNSVGL